jgi:hypothetical protein
MFSIVFIRNTFHSKMNSARYYHKLSLFLSLFNENNIYQHIMEKSSKTKLNSVALVRERTIPTERPPPVGEVSANFCG